VPPREFITRRRTTHVIMVNEEVTHLVVDSLPVCSLLDAVDDGNSERKVAKVSFLTTDESPWSCSRKEGVSGSSFSVQQE
jgi:hypothetical protein